MSDFKAKCTKIDFGRGSAPDLAVELTPLPRPLRWNKGDLPLRKGDGCREEEGRRGRRRKGKKGRGGEGQKEKRDGKRRKGRRREEEREGKRETRHTNPSLLPALKLSSTGVACLDYYHHVGLTT